MSMKTPVALLGLGVMGSGMAGRLIQNGFEVTVYNRTPGKADALRSQGAKVASTAAEAAAGAQVIISMVAQDNAARSIWLGPVGALAGARPGAVLIECSTISPGWVRELAKHASDRGCDLLDAPVTGSKPQAAAGELLFLVGGDERTVEHARPLFAAMGRGFVHLGPSGSGALVKLINNFVAGVQVVAIAEALALIERTDLNTEKALAVLTEGAPGSPMVKVAAGRMMERDFSPNFALKLMAKDLQYALAEAKARSLPLTTAAAALETLRKAEQMGRGDDDFSAVIELLRR